MNTLRIAAMAAVAMIAVQVMANAALGTEVGRVESGIRMTELMSDPIGTEVGGEWIELRNCGNASVNVGGWTLSDQDAVAELVFPDMAVEPGQFVIVHTGAGENGTDSYGAFHFYINRTTGVWNNAGDDALLTDSLGQVADFFSYGNGTGLDACPAEGYWPHAAAPPTEGFSLALADEPIGAWLPRIPSQGRANGAPSYSDEILIGRVCYAPKDSGEFMTLANAGDAEVDVSDWRMTDFDGVLAFPSGSSVEPGAELAIAENATKYFSAFGSWPDMTFAEMACVDLGFGLANEGDELLLADPWGIPLDMYIYGSSEHVGAGWEGAPATILAAGKVSTRTCDAGIFADTNTSADWDAAREIEIGQTEISPEVFATTNLTVMAFPDAGMEPVISLIDGAESEILVNMYEFTVGEAAARLSAASGRGVRVSVLVEGEPVGGFTSECAGLCDMMCAAGCDVRLMTSMDGTQERYRFDHAKYMVIDGSTLFLETENWSPNGLPENGRTGNRGWAALVREDALASHFAEVFRADWENCTVPWEEASAAISVVEPEASPAAEPFEPLFAPLEVSGFSTIRPVFSPDSSLSNDTIIGMIRSARTEILAEQMSVYKDWNHKAGGVTVYEPNPYLEEILDAARRGVGVRLLMDSTSYSGEPCMNDAAVRYLNTMAALECLNLSAKLVVPETHGFVKIHAKGMVVDGKTTLVSSINWGRNSVVENREAGLIIESAEAGAYFRAIFDYDWRDDVVTPVARVDAPLEAQVNCSVQISANGSWDDLGITRYEWLIDGRLVLSEEDLLYWVFMTSGNHTVRLTVADAWGNENWTEAIVCAQLSERCAAADAETQADSATEPSEQSNATAEQPNSGMWTLGLLSIPGIAMVAGWLLSSRLSNRTKKGKARSAAQAETTAEE